MTEDQERELVTVVERLTVEVQVLAQRTWEATGTLEANRITRTIGDLNMRLCDAFPYLRDSPGTL